MSDRNNRSWIPSVRAGWIGLFTALVDGLAALSPEPAIVDAKQKFGRLRVQLDRYDASVQALVDAAEAASLRTCEVCGAPGELVRHPDHYVQTLCLQHRGQARPPATPPMVSLLEVLRNPNEDDNA